jgi:hypothetical protein
MAEVHDRPKRLGGERREVPEGFYEPRAKGQPSFVWYVEAEIQSSRWRERKLRPAARDDDQDDDQDDDC